MAFFEELSKKIQSATYKATEKAQEVAAAAGEKGKGVAETAKTNVALLNEKRNLEKNYRAIGEWYVSTLGDEVPEAIADVVTAVRTSTEKIAAMEETLQKAKEEAGAAVEAAKDKAGDFVGKVKDKTGDLVEKVKDKTEELVEKAKDKTEAAAEEAADIAEEIRDKAEDAAEEAKEKAEEIAEELKHD